MVRKKDNLFRGDRTAEVCQPGKRRRRQANGVRRYCFGLAAGVVSIIRRRKYFDLCVKHLQAN